MHPYFAMLERTERTERHVKRVTYQVTQNVAVVSGGATDFAARVQEAMASCRSSVTERPPPSVTPAGVENGGLPGTALVTNYSSVLSSDQSNCVVVQFGTDMTSHTSIFARIAGKPFKLQPQGRVWRGAAPALKPQETFITLHETLFSDPMRLAMNNVRGDSTEDLYALRVSVIPCDTRPLPGLFGRNEVRAFKGLCAQGSRRKQAASFCHRLETLKRETCRGEFWNPAPDVLPTAYVEAIHRTLTAVSRRAIQRFHSSLFTFSPFELYSLHLFTKNHPSDVITVFAFTVQRQSVVDVPTSCPQPLQHWLTHVDRFECCERSLSDPRLWIHLDRTRALRNKISSNYHVDDWDALHTPIPPSLRSPDVASWGREGLQVARHMWIYVAPWPLKTEAVESSPFPSTPLLRNPNSEIPATDTLYLLTVVSAEFVFPCVVPVTAAYLDFLFHVWLHLVEPPKRPPCNTKRPTMETLTWSEVNSPVCLPTPGWPPSPNSSLFSLSPSAASPAVGSDLPPPEEESLDAMLFPRRASAPGKPVDLPFKGLKRHTA